MTEYDLITPQPSTKLINPSSSLSKYFDMGPIGSGRQGIVHLCIELTTDVVYACKHMTNNPCARTEAECLMVLKGATGVIQIHEAIIKEREYYKDYPPDVWIIMEYIEGQNLYNYMRTQIPTSIDTIIDITIDITKAKKIIKGIRDAIIECHNKGVAHRDLKLENIMLNKNDEIILIDFGFACQFTQDTIYSSRSPGTLSYACPELLNINAVHLTKADTWAFGVLMYILLTRYFPFGGRDDPENRHRIKELRVDYGRIKDVEAVVILKKIFVTQENRITVSDLKDDPWFEEVTTH
jgi:serine/threonine protein kinase